MAGRGLRVMNHPVHPPLTAFPIALWTTSLLWDVVALIRDEALWGQMAFWSLVVGLIAFIPTAITGFLDFLAISGDDLADRLATRHMMASFSAAALFTFSLILRRLPAIQEEPWMPLLSSIVGLVVLVLAGWLGGELVFSHAVAVTPPADSDPRPPNSS